MPGYRSASLMMSCWGHRLGVGERPLRHPATAFGNSLHQSRRQAAVIAPIRRINCDDKAIGSGDLHIPRRGCRTIAGKTNTFCIADSFRPAAQIETRQPKLISPSTIGLIPIENN